MSTERKIMTIGGVGLLLYLLLKGKMGLGFGLFGKGGINISGKKSIEISNILDGQDKNKSGIGKKLLDNLKTQKNGVALPEEIFPVNSKAIIISDKCGEIGKEVEIVGYDIINPYFLGGKKNQAELIYMVRDKNSTSVYTMSWGCLHEKGFILKS